MTTTTSTTADVEAALAKLDSLSRALNTARVQLVKAQEEFRASARSSTSDPYHTTELGTRIQPLGDRVQELEAAHRVAFAALRVAQAQTLADPPAA